MNINPTKSPIHTLATFLTLTTHLCAMDMPSTAAHTSIPLKSDHSELTPLSPSTQTNIPTILQIQADTAPQATPLDQWFAHKIMDRDLTKKQLAIASLCALTGAANMPVFTMLGMGGAEAAFTNKPFVYLLTACGGAAVGAQFVLTSWEKGKELADDQSRTGKMRLYQLAKHSGHFIGSALANIPIPYLDRQQFGWLLGKGEYALGATAFIGANISWMWSFDYYNIMLEQSVLRRFSPELQGLQEQIDGIHHFFTTCPDDKVDEIYAKMMANKPTESLDAFATLSTTYNISPPPKEYCGFPTLRSLISNTVGAGSAIISGIGAFANYNLGITATEQVLQAMGITNPFVNAVLPQASGIIAVGVSATFNVITGYQVMKSATDTAIGFISNPPTRKDLTFENAGKVALSTTKAAGLMFAAVGSSLPQTYLTLENISQNSPYALFLDICAFAGNIPSGYWAMGEIFDKVVIQTKALFRGDHPLTTDEKRGILLEICQKFQMEMYYLTTEELSELKERADLGA